MIHITFSWTTKLLIAGLLLVVSSASVRAQKTCDKAPRPCLDQPIEGATQVTGKVESNGKTTGVVIMVIVNNAPAQQAVVNPDGAFTLSGLPALNRFNIVQADQTQPAPAAGTPTPTTGPVPVLSANADVNDVPTRFTLGLFGINAAGSSSTGPSQQYFAEIDLLAPLRWLPGRACSKDDNDDPLSQRCWIWINPRIASVPSASSTAINNLSATSLTTSFGSQTLGQITQSFEFQAGGEWYVRKPSDTHFWGMGQSGVKSAVSLIVGGGALTPFNSITTAPEFGLSSNLAQQFNQNASLPSLYPQLASALCSYGFTGSNCPSTLPATKPTTVAFVFPNRSRFYRGFYGGLRFRFFYFTGNCHGTSPSATCKAMNTYPGTFDLRVGEDESVTGGHLVPLVVTLTGSFPIPGTKGTVRLFGSSYIRAYRNQNTLALILVPSSNFTSLDNPAVVVQPIPRSDQDYFRLGVGIDLFAALSKLVGK